MKFTNGVQQGDYPTTIEHKVDLSSVNLKVLTDKEKVNNRKQMPNNLQLLNCHNNCLIVTN